MSNSIKSHPTVAIIGAGMSGTLLSIYLARQGFRVSIFENRDDVRTADFTGARSINMTLSERGIRSLDQVGLKEQILSITVPLRGRMVHDQFGIQSFQPYGQDSHEQLYCIKRHELNSMLVEAADSYDNTSIYFNHKCVRIDKENGRFWIETACKSDLIEHQATFIVGADGVFSSIREQMQKAERADYQRTFLDWGYKELAIPASIDSDLLLNRNALHVWARKTSLLLALPNNDGTFTCNLIMPLDSDRSFDMLETGQDSENFFRSEYGDVTRLIPDLHKQLVAAPASHFITIQTSQWYYKNKVVLIGDACHAVVPFYGQGMNAAFEDCQILSACIAKTPDRLEEAFTAYQQLRKENTDVLADISVQNFVMLRDKVESPILAARKKMDFILHKLFPNHWYPLYTLISHTCIPYADALSHYERQKRIGRYMGLEIVTGLLAFGLHISNSHGKSTLSGYLRPLARKVH